MKINSGELNQKIQVMQIEKIADGSMGTVPVETVYWDTFAKATPYISRVQSSADQLDLVDGYKFILRYRVDKSIRADMRVKYRGGYLKIISSPTNFVDKEHIEIIAIWQDRPVGNG